MNTKAFAVAAIFGASAAFAGECPDAAGLPSNFNDLSWKDQALAKFQYMDNCPRDDQVTYRELQRYASEVPSGLIHHQDPDSVQDQIFESMIRIDDDSNSIIDLQEYLRSAQIYNQPITDQYDEDEKFNYLSCKPQEDGGEYHKCRYSYDRQDLRQTIWMIQEGHEQALDGIATDHVEERLAAYEIYINKEFRLRDYNNDGQITREEHNRHNLYRQDVRQTYEDILDNQEDDKISRATYEALGDSHPWLHYYGAEQAFDKMDSNRDNMLSLDEAWEATQMDDIIWRKFDAIYEKIDLDDDDKVTYQEVLAYVSQDFEGAMTSEQLRQKAQEFFDKYNRSSFEPDGRQVIEKKEAWRVVSADDHAEERDAKFQRDLRYKSKTGWMAYIDTDHDDIVLAQDLIGIVEDDTLVSLFDLLGKNPATDAFKWQEVYDGYILKEYHGYRQLRDDWMSAIHDGEASYTFTLADIDNDKARAHFQETREELERVFHEMDTNNDGVVNGEEACRAWIGDYDILCTKFAPEYSSNWLNLIERWIVNPLSMEARF